ncbi:hypothetical protein NXS11_02995 [Staphylococcus sp. GRT3]|uniref:Peptidase S8/S53 domain-containing protein n=1 Tax=Staphylococcus americanisciuri TaxID=2973940 RepID=A0ABT2F0A4_9STAP|nr:hypothetical protein [Staphylococcus americanisciuri]
MPMVVITCEKRIAIEVFTKVIDYAISRNIVMVSSAGNDGIDTSKTDYIPITLMLYLYGALIIALM